jgi:hypothetical protein
MPRTSHRITVSAAVAAAFAIALAACGSPSLPALTDPTEIVTAALKATETARSVHLDATLDGSINADLTGSGTASELPLNGTTASADVDMAGGRAHATFAIPAFLNLNGELIQIGQTSYVRTSLTGPQFETQQVTDSLPVDPTDASGIVDEVGDFLTKDGVDPVKGDDVDCGGKRCYTVSIELTPEELAALGAGQAEALGLPLDVGAASLAITIRVEKDTYHLGGVTIVASLGEQGTLTLNLTLSRWDQPMDISPPPADQVKPAT